MACEDTRQLTEAQRVAGFQNQRTGVAQAVRPFSGNPTVENLVDYINRELYPAVRATRSKVNDIYLPTVDNAPSGNPLAFYFSEETGAADPTAGRIRLNASPQDTATVMRVSQSNARLVDVAPWLDVMAGGATTPLGVVTLTDAINPGRFLRFDLNTMTDQGVYWDLGITIIEGSHDDPFVDDGAVVLSFIPGVGGVTPATVPASSITPIATDTFLGNISGSTAAPVAVPLASVDSASVIYDAASHTFQRAALTGGDISSAQDSNALTIDNNAVTNAKLRDSAGLSVIGRSTSSSGDPADIVSLGGDRYFKSSAANTSIGFFTPNIDDFPAINHNRFIGNISGVTAPMSSNDFFGLASDATGGIGWNATTSHFELFAIGTDTFLGNLTAGTATPTATSFTLLTSDTIRYDGASKTLFREALTGDVTAPQNSNTTTIADDAVTDAKLRESAALSVIGRSANSTGNPADISTTAASGAVLRESGGVLAFGTVATGGLADDSVTNAVLAEMAANTVKANATAGTANPTDFAIGTNSVLGRVAGNIVAAQVATGQIADDAVTDAKLRNSNACSVIGRAPNSSGDPADILATTNDRVLARSGDSVAFQLVTNEMIAPGDIELSRLTGINANTVIGNDTGSATNPVEIAIGTNTVLGRVGGNIVAAQLATGQIADDAVTDAKLRESAALSVIGRTVNSTGNPADIGAGTDGHVLRRSGTSLGFGTIATAGIADNAVDDTKLVNMAESRIKGRPEGAGTGDPTDLTPTEVVSIIDGESPTWTASHRFDSFIQFGSSTGLPSVGDIREAGTLQLASAADVRLTADDDVVLEAGDEVLLLAQGHVLVAGATSTSAGQLKIYEGASPASNAAGEGQIRVDDVSPNRLMFIDDENAEWPLNVHGVGGAIDRNSLTNSVALKAGVTFTVPADTMRNAVIYRFWGKLMVTRGATATAAFVSVRCGRQGGGASASADMPALSTVNGTVHIYQVEGHIECVVAGGSGTGAVYVNVVGIGGENGQAASISGSASAASQGMDTTVDNDIELHAQFSAAVANLSLQWLQCHVTRIA